MATNPFVSPPSSPTTTSSLSETRSAEAISMPESHSSRTRVHTHKSSGSKSASDRPSSKPAGTRSRSQSEDSVTLAARRAKPAKKGSSMHADIIDHLDISGVGAAMFHHDGPFDACAPSRNRHRTKAPMLAWSSTDRATESTDQPHPPEPIINPALAKKVPKLPLRTSSDYVGAGRLGDHLPKKRNDALAEAWGVAEPEPFEEFFAGGGSGRASAASSIRAGTDGPLSFQQRRGREGKADIGSERPRFAARRSTQRAPPPKPIAVPGGDGDYPEADIQVSVEPGSPGAKRSRSLMQRIRKMRETPNVPVTAQLDSSDSIPTSGAAPDGKHGRPTHRPNQSFLGRFGKSPNTPTFDNPPISPFSDKSAASIDENGKEKQLPRLPGDSPVTPGGTSGGEGYFDHQGGSSDASPGAGISRRTSLMRKVVNGVKRGART